MSFSSLAPVWLDFSLHNTCEHPGYDFKYSKEIPTWLLGVLAGALHCTGHCPLLGGFCPKILSTVFLRHMSIETLLSVDSRLRSPSLTSIPGSSKLLRPPPPNHNEFEYPVISSGGCLPLASTYR